MWVVVVAFFLLGSQQLLNHHQMMKTEEHNRFITKIYKLNNFVFNYFINLKIIHKDIKTKNIEMKKKRFIFSYMLCIK